MTPKQLVKHYFPEASDEEATSILWECTGFPSFWNEGRSPAECLNIQLYRIARRSHANVGQALLLACQDLEKAMESR